MGVVFGCETRETGEIFNQEADGILGLGNSEISVINQVGAAPPWGFQGWLWQVSAPLGSIGLKRAPRPATVCCIETQSGALDPGHQQEKSCIGSTRD